MKKTILVLIFFALTVLSTACASVSISYLLNEDNVVGVSYIIDLEESEEEAIYYLNQIKEYWDEQGFEASIDSDELSVSGEKYNQYSTAAQAAASFADIVTSDNVMFYDVLFEYSPSFEYDIYSFSAKISLKEIVRQSQPQDIPSDVISFVRNNAAQGMYTVSVKLPGTVTSSNANSIEDNICTWVLNYGEESELQIKTEKINTDNLAYRASLENRINNNQILLVICIAAGVVFLFAVAIAIIVRRARIKNASVVRAKRFS